MTVAASHLPPRNPVAILDEATNLVVGVGGKAEVHSEGRPHASVFVLVRVADGRLVLYRRHPKQSYPNCLDLFGGHYEPADAPDPRTTAWRETGEELRFVASRLQVQPEPNWLVDLSDPFALESMDVRNRERSTLFGVRVPAGVSVEAAGDTTDSGHAVPATAEILHFDELCALAAKNPESLADGLARALAAVREDPDVRRRVESFLKGE